jgi:hypothetical protein
MTKRLNRKDAERLIGMLNRERDMRIINADRLVLDRKNIFGANDYAAEASEVGFLPGEWPTTFTVPTIGEFVMCYGSDAARVYHSRDGNTIMIFND